VLSQTNAAAGDRFLFQGREFDAEIALYYYRARYYDPALGRFISQDPMGFAAGDANLYRFVKNSPLNGTDPSGQAEMVEGANVWHGVGLALLVALLAHDNYVILTTGDPSKTLIIQAISYADSAIGRLQEVHFLTTAVALGLALDLAQGKNEKSTQVRLRTKTAVATGSEAVAQALGDCCLKRVEANVTSEWKWCIYECTETPFEVRVPWPVFWSCPGVNQFGWIPELFGKSRPTGHPPTGPMPSDIPVARPCPDYKGPPGGIPQE
jgi:RHS repeat-associated protein